MKLTDCQQTFLAVVAVIIGCIVFIYIGVHHREIFNTKTKVYGYEADKCYRGLDCDVSEGFCNFLTYSEKFCHMYVTCEQAEYDYQFEQCEKYYKKGCSCK